MGPDNPVVSAKGVPRLLGQLSDTVRRIDADDLSSLAQMHGWCESLIECCSGHGDDATKLVTGQARALAQRLEQLILAEVADTGVAFAEIGRCVAELCESAAAGAPVDEPPAPAKDIEPVGRDDFLPLTEEFPAGLENVPAAPEPQDALPTPAEPAAGDAPYEPVPLHIDAKEREFVKGFVEEAAEHIEAIETAVLEVERNPDDAGRIDDLFRPFHTIKGMAGFLNLRDINCLTHEVETLLDQGRKGKRSVTPGVIDIVFGVVDTLKAQIAEVANWVREPHGGAVPQPPVAEKIDMLRAVIAGRLKPDGQPGMTPPPRRAARGLAEPVIDRRQGDRREQPDVASTPGTAGGKSVVDHSIRIETGKLDALVDMVGELVIAQTLVNMNAEVQSNHRLLRDVTQVTKIVRDVQALAMAMRMVPIGPTFQKMGRLVRDVSRKAGKTVELTISGEDTELDKTVIQEIGDPLVHMVRNAVDHGIEAAAVRRAAGKPEVGRVHLRAGHEGGNVVIEISDDGRGLDAAGLIAKGIEKGLVEPGEELTDQQAFALIFAPGFSTADQVTDISGRGVGMDVVRRNIEQLRGRIEIDSQKGQGTTFSIRLPLTLAIIDGMVIGVGGERFIIPTITIEQSLRPLPEQLTTVHHRGEILNVRGQLIPLIQLGQLFGLTGRIDPCKAMVVIAHCENSLVGLVVQELIGQQQIVIKSLGERFERLQGVSGAAILGDGRVGLILEMSGLLAAHHQLQRVSECQRTAPRGCGRDRENTPAVPADVQAVTFASPEAGRAVLT